MAKSATLIFHIWHNLPTKKKRTVRFIIECIYMKTTHKKDISRSLTTQETMFK